MVGKDALPLDGIVSWAVSPPFSCRVFASVVGCLSVNQKETTRWPIQCKFG